MKRLHAEHNESLCAKLLSEDKYRDWVITTAFYSAIHYIDHKLFPLQHDGGKFENISQIRSYLRAPSPHCARERIVQLYLNDQISNYDFLDKNCRNARYNNYIVNQKKATIAFQRLSQIRDKCTI